MSVDYESNVLDQLRAAIHRSTGTHARQTPNTIATALLVEAFRAFDVDNNDHVSTHELKVGLQRFCGLHCSNLEIDILMNSAGGGGSGGTGGGGNSGGNGLTKSQFVQWLGQGAVGAVGGVGDDKERAERRRRRIGGLMYDLVGSPREAWLNVFRKGGGGGSRKVISLDQFVSGMKALFDRHDFMVLPTVHQLKQIFNHVSFAEEECRVYLYSYIRGQTSLFLGGILHRQARSDFVQDYTSRSFILMLDV